MMKDRVKRVAESEGLPFADRTRTYNSRLAQELGKWAEHKHKGDAFHHAAFSAYFAEGKNIAKIRVLLDIAGSIGLDRGEAEEVIAKRMFQSEVDEDWALSRKTGITAVPTFVMDGGRLVGAQPYEMLKELMESKRIPKK